MMSHRGAPTGRFTRRRFLAGSLGGPYLIPRNLRGELRTFPPERVRYPDPATEFELHRLTDPANAYYLPPTYARIFTRRGSWLLCVGDRTGSLQAYALDLKSWEIRQLTEATKLDRHSMTLTVDDRYVCYLDSSAVWVAQVSGGRARKIYDLSKESAGGSGMAAIPDGPALYVIDGQTRLMLVGLARTTASVVVTAREPIFDPRPRPRRASVLYRTGPGDLWLAHLDGTRNIPLKTAAGSTGPAIWTPDGRAILYLNYPEGGGLHALRELDPDTGEDRFLASTTQFIQFGCNSDASVFVGASKSLASPFVLLLIRAARRELTLCEHKSQMAGEVSPVFSPDSQRIFFQSDRHGKPAIYSMVVDKLVERTDSE
jgi:oligogalacturonide lyase